MPHAKVGIKKKDTGWAELFERVYKIATAGKVKVGWFDDGPTGQAHDPKSGLTIAMLAAILEFGTEDGHIPSRPVLRATFDAKHGEIEKLARELIIKILDGKINEKQALGLMGAWFASECKKYVTAEGHVQPENAESTIVQKGSDRPWVDTGRTIGALTWIVDGGSGEKHSKHGGGEEHE